MVPMKMCSSSPRKILYRSFLFLFDAHFTQSTCDQKV
jgi:hypothetical protein